MPNKKIFLAIIFAMTMGIISQGHAGPGQAIAPGQQIPNQEILGTWACQVVRAQNLSARPLTLTMHADGTTTYSSATNISNLGFDSRGNGYGDWEKVGAHDYRFQAQEMLRINGDAGGRFLVDATLHVRSAAEITPSSPDKICTVSLPNDPCPTNNNVRATQFVFSGGLNDPISGEVDLLNTGGNGVILSALRCNPLNTVTTFGSSDPVFPIPAPVP